MSPLDSVQQLAPHNKGQNWRLLASDHDARLPYFLLVTLRIARLPRLVRYLPQFSEQPGQVGGYVLAVLGCGAFHNGVRLDSGKRSVTGRAMIGGSGFGHLSSRGVATILPQFAWIALETV